jgi:hypothetical protein
MIIVHNLIKQLGLQLNFGDSHTISLEDQVISIVPQHIFKEVNLQQTFPISTLELAEQSFENKSPSMFAADC